MGVFLLLNEDGTFTRLKFLCSEEDGTPAQPTVLHLRTETLTKILAGLPKDEKNLFFSGYFNQVLFNLKTASKNLLTIIFIGAMFFPGFKKSVLKS